MAVNDVIDRRRHVAPFTRTKDEAQDEDDEDDEDDDEKRTEHEDEE